MEENGDGCDGCDERYRCGCEVIVEMKFLGLRTGCVDVGGVGKVRCLEAEAHRRVCGILSLWVVLPPSCASGEFASP